MARSGAAVRGGHGRAGILACVIAGTVGCGYLKGEPPWPEGQPFQDPALVTLLRPDVPVARDGLFRTATGDFFYEATLQGTSPDGYEDRYGDLLQRRAVLVRPIGSSPHAFPPRTMGWFTQAYRPGRQSPFTLFTTEYQDRDQEWLKNHWNAPDPVQTKDDRLRLRLGRLRQPWTETILVPTQDVAEVPELPLRRFPGAVLKSTHAIGDEDALLTEVGVSRMYVVRGKSSDDVVSHYKTEAEKLGIQATVGDGKLWVEDGPSGLVRLSVSRSQIFIAGADLATAEQKWPHLMAGFPKDSLQYRVSAHFKDAATALQYRTPAERMRSRPEASSDEARD